MMHDEDGDVVLALQGAEVAEQRGDLSGVVLVDAMKSHEGIEDEEARRVAANRVAQTRLIAPANEAGGSAYAFSAAHALAQYAVTGTFHGTFYATDEEQLARVTALASAVEPELVAKTALYCRQSGTFTVLSTFGPFPLGPSLEASPHKLARKFYSPPPGSTSRLAGRRAKRTKKSCDNPIVAGSH
jgi:hypothetical protein